ncbi:MAG: hypothetical protein QY317_06655 [Candidatus Jettenia caeni]|nr:MAG: hypothetical protein QY317_06655 [Candidatus Jettenia caeni]
MHKASILPLTLAFVLLGCGTVPTPMSKVKQVPQSRVRAALPSASKSPARITVIRDSGFQGIEHVFELRINGTLVAELRPKEAFAFDVDPGLVFLEIRMFNIIGKVAPVQVETTVEPNKRYFYRAGIDG